MKFEFELSEIEVRALLFEFVAIEDFVRQRASLAVRNMAKRAREVDSSFAGFNDYEAVSSSSLLSADERNASEDGEINTPRLLAAAISAKRNEIDKELSRRLIGVFAGHKFELDDISAARFNNALSIAESTLKLGQEWPGIKWTDVENGVFSIPNIDTLRAMAASLGAQGGAVYAVWQEHKVKVSSCKTVKKVKAYDVSAGWPDLV